MKICSVFLLAALSTTLSVSAQKLSQSETLQTSEVVKVPGATKDELFARAQSWLIRTYSPDDAPIQRADRDAGVIAGSGTYAYKGGPTISGEIWHTISIQVRDGQYRYTFSDFYFMPAQGSPSAFESKFMKDNDIIRSNAQETLNGIISKMKADMAEKKQLPKAYRHQLHWPGSGN